MKLRIFGESNNFIKYVIGEKTMLQEFGECHPWLLRRRILNKLHQSPVKTIWVFYLYLIVNLAKSQNQIHFENTNQIRLK